MTNLKVMLLGAPRVEINGVPIEVDTRKAIALIAYLAVTGQEASRDSLAALLWPENGQTSARAALRRTLSALNKALAGEWLAIERESLALRGGPDYWLDLAEFHKRLAECRTHGHGDSDVCAACLAPLAEAVRLYRGDFLAGFSLRDSPSFDDWQFFQAEGFRRELAGAIERLVRCHALAGQWDEAITYGRRWLQIDPLHEPAHQRLMQLYDWAGQRAAALHQYRECVRALDQELGVTPLEATTRLYQAIKENHAPPPPPGSELQPGPVEQAGELERGADRAGVQPTLLIHHAPSHVPSPKSKVHHPLVGRSSEWAILAETYAAVQGNGQVVALEGEAGIGKTRLAENFLDDLRGRGATVIAARCYEGETHLAYAPFLQALRATVTQLDRAGRLAQVSTHALGEVARLLPEIAQLRPDATPAAPLDGPGAQSRFFDGIRELLLRLGGDQPPPALFLDDAQWADEASLDLLTYLVRRLHDQPVYLLITIRSEDTPAHHRLRYLLGEAQRTGIGKIITLDRLSRAAVTELVEAATPEGASWSASLAGRLYDETEGLPFFLVEYIAALAAQDEVLGDEWSLPGGVRDLLHARLHAVSETGWQLLTTASVIGRSFDFDTLREASGRGEEETVAALEALMEQGLVAEVSGRNDGALTYDFSHEKLRAMVYEESSLARRRLLHRRVASALVGRARGLREPGVLAGQIASHYQLAGEERMAADYFRQAGEHARALYANAEALTYFRSALAFGHPDAAALHEAIGDLQTLAGEYEEALASYEKAAALGAPEAAGAVEHKLALVHHRRGEWELAESHLAAALAMLDGGSRSGERARLYADWSLTAHRRGVAARALELAHESLRLAQSADEARALAQAHNILGILATDRGDVEEARAHLEESLRLAERLGEPSARAAALNNLALAFRESDNLDRALTLTQNALSLSVAQGDRHREAALHNNLADLLHAAGRSEEAMFHLKQAAPIFAEIGYQAGAWRPEIWKLTEW